MIAQILRSVMRRRMRPPRLFAMPRMRQLVALPSSGLQSSCKNWTSRPKSADKGTDVPMASAATPAEAPSARGPSGPPVGGSPAPAAAAADAPVSADTLMAAPGGVTDLCGTPAAGSSFLRGALHGHGSCISSRLRYCAPPTHVGYGAEPQRRQPSLASPPRDRTKHPSLCQFASLRWLIRPTT